MVEELYKLNTLLSGIDPGNTSTKTSFLNKEGNMEDFAISTIIAPAPTQAVEMKDNHKDKKEVAIEEFLHIRLTTNSLYGEEKDHTWYVGEYAKNKTGARQPNLNSEGESEEKFSDKNKALFVVPTLTSLAVAALKAGKDKVEVPLSIGVPVDSYKLKQQSLIEMFIGNHEVIFLDGPYANHKIEIVIKDGEIQVEGVTTSIALEFSIENGECVETEIGKEIGENYALGDLGAGTTDIAVFTENGIEKSQTKNTYIGTNKYIDSILDEIANLEVFAEVKERRKASGKKGAELLPYPSREKFVNDIIKPEIERYIDAVENNEQYEMKFKVSWGWKKNVDITEIVVKHITQYAQAQKDSLLVTYSDLEVDAFVLVGGGVLFGYAGGLRDLAEDYGMKFPSLKDSQYFTSRAYLIANYLNQLEKQLV